MRLYSYILKMIVSLALLATTIYAQPQYQIINLGTLGGINSIAEEVNESGQVVGYGPDSTSPLPKAFSWQNGDIINLGTLGGLRSWAYGVNDSGQVVGYSRNAADDNTAFLWQNGNMIDLGTLGGIGSGANDINNSSQVVGTSGSAANGTRAFIWQNGNMTELGTLGGDWSWANSINESGHVVGAEMDSFNWLKRAFLWQNGNMIDLGSLGTGWEHEAHDINNLNQVVGTSNYKAFLWQNGNMTGLGELPGGTRSYAYSINDSGRVVGAATYTGQPSDLAAVIWQNGSITNLNNLIDSTSGWFLYHARGINNLGHIAGTGRYNDSTRAFLLIPNTSAITNPKPGDKWKSGETDTIKWTETGWFSINIKCVLNFGTPSEETITIEEGILPDSTIYEWTIPDTLLSYKSKIVIENYADTTEKIESGIFRIKPYVLTRLNSDSTYYAYKKNRDQWGFSNIQPDMWPPSWYNNFNYQGQDPFTQSQYSQWQGGSVFASSQSLQHPDWISFVNTFGTSACYFSTTLNIYSPTAMSHWKSKKRTWGGSCFGIAGANALAFGYKSQFVNKFPIFPNFVNPISVTAVNTVRKIVNEIFTHQHGNPSIANDNVSIRIKTPNQTLNELKQILVKDSCEARSITIFNNSGSGAHTILAYGLEQDSVQNNIYRILVYDNSSPTSNNPITIDTTGNSGNGVWSTPDWAGWGGNTNIYLELTADKYLNSATFSRGGMFSSPFIKSVDTVDVFYPSESSIRIIDNLGNVTGYFNNIVESEIEGSVPRIIKNGSESPPYGYSLLTDNYSIVLDEFAEDTLETFFFTGNKTFAYERYSAIPGQTDRLFFDGGVSVSNPDAQTKTVNLLNIVNETTQEKLFTLKSVDLAQNDSIKIINPDDNNLDVISYGSSKNYQLELNYASSSGLGRFINDNISLSQNTTHKLVPDWSDFDELQLIIYVDEGNDGSIDDTVEVANTLSATTFTLSVSVDDGWNMVSVPGINPDGQGVESWWSGRVGDVFNFNNGYQAITSATPGEGYWMKNSGKQTYNTGDEWPAGGIEIVAHDPISAFAGWNLIGGYENSAAVSGITTNPSGLVDGPVYGYSGGYTTPFTMEPGYGYWIKLSGAGDIILPTALAKGTESAEWFNDDWGRIVITDAEGISYTLYAVQGDVDLDQYELPPAPPEGMFDIRYSSGRIAEDLNSAIQTIEMSGVTYPLVVRVENIAVTLQDESGKVVNENLNPDDEVTINNPLNKLVVHSSEYIAPVQFELEQNYPNPFNPATNIKYSIPEASFVQLKVYDILGNEVATLVNEEKSIGIYRIEFDASVLPTGVYFYRIQAASFVKTKKMILLR